VRCGVGGCWCSCAMGMMWWYLQSCHRDRSLLFLAPVCVRVSCIVPSVGGVVWRYHDCCRGGCCRFVDTFLTWDCKRLWTYLTYELAWPLGTPPPMPVNLAARPAYITPSGSSVWRRVRRCLIDCSSTHSFIYPCSPRSLVPYIFACMQYITLLHLCLFFLLPLSPSPFTPPWLTLCAAPRTLSRAFKSTVRSTGHYSRTVWSRATPLPKYLHPLPWPRRMLTCPQGLPFRSRTNCRPARPRV
jgi:hypothetical protein